MNKKEQLKLAISDYQNTGQYTNELGKMIMDLSSAIVYSNFKTSFDKDDLISIAALGISEVLLKVDTDVTANEINNYLWLTGKGKITASFAKAKVEREKITKYKQEYGSKNYDIIDNEYIDDFYFNGKKGIEINDE